MRTKTKDREAKQRSTAAQTRATRDRGNGTVTVSLRIPGGMLNEIDEALQNRPYKMPRHMWLLEAIHEKLMRSQQSGGKNGQAIAEGTGR